MRLTGAAHSRNASMAATTMTAVRVIAKMAPAIPSPSDEPLSGAVGAGGSGLRRASSHFALNGAGMIPGRLPAGRPIHGKQEAAGASRGAVRRQPLDFLQEAVDWRGRQYRWLAHVFMPGYRAAQDAAQTIGASAGSGNDAACRGRALRSFGSVK